MRVTAKEAAAILGVSDRTIRLKLAKGQLSGVKLPDPTTGADTWFVDLPEDPIQPPFGSTPTSPRLDPEIGLPEAGNVPSSGHPDDGGGWISFAAHQEMVERLHRENLELAGRVGFYQAKLQESAARLELAEARITLLEAPKPETSAESSTATKPWWKFW